MAHPVYLSLYTSIDTYRYIYIYMSLSLHKYFRFLDGLSDFGTPLDSERCLLTRWTNKKNKWIQRDKLVLCQVESSGRGLINVFSVFCFSVCKITQKLTRLDLLDGGVERGQNKKPLNPWCKCSLHIKTARKENGLGRGLCFHSVPSSFIKRISYICTILHTTFVQMFLPRPQTMLCIHADTGDTISFQC